MKVPEILDACRRAQTEDAEQVTLPKNQARMLAWLAEWKVQELQVLWKDDPDYFQRMRETDPCP